MKWLDNLHLQTDLLPFAISLGITIDREWPEALHAAVVHHQDQDNHSNCNHSWCGNGTWLQYTAAFLGSAFYMNPTHKLYQATLKYVCVFAILCFLPKLRYYYCSITVHGNLTAPYQVYIGRVSSLFLKICARHWSIHHVNFALSFLFINLGLGLQLLGLFY